MNQDGPIFLTWKACRSRIALLVTLTVASILLPVFSTFAQTRSEEEEYCFNGNGQKEMMIGGGKDADIEKWAFIVALRQRDDHNVEQSICGGSLLSATWALTAAHCVTTTMGNIPTERLSVSQSLDQRGMTVESSTVRVKRIELPPGFSWVRGEDVHNDVALLKLVAPFVSAIPNVYYPIPASAVIERTSGKPDRCAGVAGWGLMVDDQLARVPNLVLPKRLQDLNVLIWNEADCRQAYPAGPNQVGIRPDHFCAGFKVLRKNSCKGDSGGPLIVREGPTGAFLLGVLHAGPASRCPGDRPNVYTRVSAHRDWIIRTMAADP